LFDFSRCEIYILFGRREYIFTTTVQVLFFSQKTRLLRPEVIFVSCSSNLKAKLQEEGVDKTWKLLVKKVTRARVMSALASREVPEVVKKSWAKSSSRRAARFR